MKFTRITVRPDVCRVMTPPPAGGSADSRRRYACRRYILARSCGRTSWSLSGSASTASGRICGCQW